MRPDQASRPGWVGGAVTAVVLVLAACTGDQNETAPTSVTEPPTTRPAPTTTPTTEARCKDVFCVEYHIDPDATWADQVPVTASDFVFTFETIIDPNLSISSRQGYEIISGYEVIDDKTIIFDFSEIYAPWQNLFSPVLPRHVLEGEAFNSIWDAEITMGSGPFVFAEWIPGERIVLARNPDYWGDAGGDVQSVDIVFLEGPDAQVEALRDQEIDMFYPEPDADLVADVDTIDSVEWEAGLGTTWEHFAFNFDDPRLQNLYVRQAIAQAINREAILEAVVRPIASDVQLLGNSIWPNTSRNYEDHFNAVFPYAPAAAEALLVENGCVRSGDGVFECDGQRLSFTWSTTGNEGRELQFALAQTDLAVIGIEVTANFVPFSQLAASGFFFGPSDQWQILNFAWIGSHDPQGGNSLYYCEGEAPNGFGEINNLRYCNEQVDALIRSTDSIVDPAERAEVYNQADALWLAEVPLIPLYQKPTFFAWNSVIEGPRDNPTQVGPLWNIGDWTGKENVIFGVDQEPESLNVLEPDGSLFISGLISSAILEGAYTVSPELEYVPQLVESAETIVP